MAAVRYMVRDVPKAVEFYTSHLAFEVDQQWRSAFALLRRRDLALWLSGPETSAARPMPDGARPEPGGWNRIVLEVEDLEAIITKMRAAGVQFRNEIIAGPGGRQILAQDPDGNLIELFEAGKGA